MRKVIPSINQLIDICTYECASVNGVKGGKFTSKTNGGIIFLPAAGYRYDSGLGYAGSEGYYWTSAQGPSDTYYAVSLDFGSGYTYWYDHYRYYGRSVRPVVRN